MKHMKRSVLPVLGLFLLASACNVSTAHISSLKVGKDKDVTQPSATFAPTDTIYGAAEIGNAGKTTDKVRLIVVDVAGQQPGPIPGLESSVALDSSGTASFNFSPPTAGWPAGKYKFEVSMLDESGVQKDQKTADITVQ
ncbi:MAG TPA: hypothetical protein VNN08_25265 [Thermoanaerobaculia bacterium]|nr:hypothetical protein [Thermoanaerobaculia bacterium]